MKSYTFDLDNALELYFQESSEFLNATNFTYEIVFDFLVYQSTLQTLLTDFDHPGLDSFNVMYRRVYDFISQNLSDLRYRGGVCYFAISSRKINSFNKVMEDPEGDENVRTE